MRRNLWMLAAIFFVVVAAAWIALPNNPGIHFEIGGLKVDREIKVYQGLDLQGGMQVTLEADVPAGTDIEPTAMEAVRTIIENRINALGVSEPLIQMQPETNRILVELPGIRNPEEAIKSFRGTGLLEFVDTGYAAFPPGAEIVTTTGGPTSTEDGAQATPAPAPDATPQAEATPAPAPESQQPIVYETILTGRDLRGADVRFDEFGRPYIHFSLTSEGATKFGEHTRANIGRHLTIVMDKRVLSSPVIQDAIMEGEGRITGMFSLAEAQSIVIQLKYGALPVPLKIVENRTVGPTLGEESVSKSLTAGLIGLIIVTFFMVAYYRFPGIIAVVVLVAYTTIVFATFKMIPVVLTLAGIAGFILSIGMAVDANILIFERTKEELRSGKTLGAAIEAGFNRAWTSIFDSNMSTIITCAILFWFGMNFGASVIRGFALTLAIGVIVSMFTAILVTRTVLRVLHYWAAGNPARAQRWRELWAW